MKNVDIFYDKLKKEIEESQTGHLSLNSRVQLMKSINSYAIVNKIFYNCVLQVKRENSKEFAENELFYSLLFEAKEYLYNDNGKKEQFELLFNKYKEYLTEYNALGRMILSLCINIATDAIFILDIDEYDGSDDDKYDFEVWTPDFWAELIISGSNPFVKQKNVDVSKRKSYWLWYLEMVKIVCKFPDNEFVPLIYHKKDVKNNIIIPARNQLNQEIYLLFDKVTSIILELIPSKKKEECIKISFTSCLVDMLNISYSNGDKVNLNRIAENQICNMLRNIRKSMYENRKKEGAWFQIEVLVSDNSSYTLDFNYDNFERMPVYFQNPDWILGLIEDFPRSKEYTPHWLRKIIGKKIKYLD